MKVEHGAGAIEESGVRDWTSYLDNAIWEAIYQGAAPDEIRHQVKVSLEAVAEAARAQVDSIDLTTPPVMDSR